MKVINITNGKINEYIKLINLAGTGVDTSNDAEVSNQGGQGAACAKQGIGAN